MSHTPGSFSHIGLSVPDVDAAVKFYSEVLGFYVIMPPTDVVEDDSDIGVMCTDVFGPAWKKLRTTPGYTDPEIISNITNYFLRPTPYSQL